MCHLLSGMPGWLPPAPSHPKASPPTSPLPLSNLLRLPLPSPVCLALGAAEGSPRWQVSQGGGPIGAPDGGGVACKRTRFLGTPVDQISGGGCISQAGPVVVKSLGSGF